ncbi:MAG: signal peptidase I [Candidatus Lokiarchaeota archaeon]|nr:signal peptidase I [Candidatus Lokiarchaeota archaeon]
MLILSVWVSLMGGEKDHFDGTNAEKVNSASDFNENSFEKTKSNQESLGFIQKIKLNLKRSMAVIVRGFSMSGVFEDGDVVGAKKVTRFSRYKKGDIIVFTNKDGERVIHMIVGFTYENGKKEYITWGVNNQEIDNDPVPRNKIEGKVVMSVKEQYNILAQARQGKLLIIDANGMVVLADTKKANINTKLQNFIS